MTRDEVILAVGDVLLKACEGPSGKLHPWKPFDVTQVAKEIVQLVESENVLIQMVHHSNSLMEMVEVKR
jgi:hypothetical protein